MPIDLEFRGIGDDVLATIREAAELTSKLRGAVVATNDAQEKSGKAIIAQQEQYQATIEGSVAAVTELGKVSAQSSKALSGELEKTAQSAQKLDGALTEVERTNVQGLVNSMRQVAAAEGIVVKQLDAEKKARFDVLVQAKLMTAEEAKLVTEAIELSDALNAQVDDIEASSNATKSLKAQFTDAKNEAAEMIARFGEFSPEAIEATQKAANLKDQIGDINARIEDLNPDAGGLGGFARLGSVFANGAQAVGGFFNTFGIGDEKIQQAAQRLQSFALGIQGAKEFLTGFGDTMKTILVTLGLTTRAQVTSTVATNADTVAKRANAAATATATTGVKAFIASLLTSPLAPFIILLGAVGAAFALLGDDAEDAATEVENLFDALEALRGMQVRDIEQRIALNKISTEAQLIAVESTKEEAEIRRAAAIEEHRLLKEKEQLLINNANAVDAEIEKKSKLGDLDEEEIQALRNKSAALRTEARQASDDAEQFVANANLQTLRFRQQITDEERRTAQERRRIREQLANDLAAVEKTLSERINALQLEAASPGQKLAIQRKAADEEIQLLRQTLLRKQALLEVEKELGVKAFQELSEAQKQARADALISSGQIELSNEQEEKFQSLSIATWDKYYKELDALQRDQAQTRLSLIADGNERERQALEISLQERSDKLREAGATEKEIAEANQRERDKLSAGQAQRSRDVEEEIAINRIEAIKAGGDQSAEAQEAAERQILLIKLEYAEKALAALGDAQDQETRLRRSQLQKSIAELKADLTNAEKNTQPVDLFDLLGIKFDSAEQKAAVEDAVQSIIRLVEQSIAAQAAEVDAQISATDELIADRERRTESLQDQLSQEIQLAQQGLANNVDGVRAQIAENEKALAADKAQKARLLEERKKFARQQLIIEGAQQVSSLITTGANLLANESLKGIVGVIAGIGFMASVFAAFAAFKARAAAINSGGGQQFRKGGSVEGLMDGPTHEGGGLGIYDERTGKRKGEMEGGEFIVNKGTSLTYRQIVEALNRNDIMQVADLALRELMDTSGISLSHDNVREMVTTKERYVDAAAPASRGDNEALLQKVDVLTKEVRSFKEQQKPAKNSVEHLPDGGRIERKGNTIERVRKVKYIKK